MKVSIIIPVLNEESALGPLLDHLRAFDPDEIIVVDGHSKDRTAETVNGPARLLVAPQGRGPQLNAGAAAAEGDVLLFLHADVRLSPAALASLRRALTDPAVVGGNFDVRYQGGCEARIFTWINRWRRRCGIFYGDSGIFCRRSVFQSLGGYQAWPILEDYEFARRLRQSGPLALLADPIYVSPRRWQNAGLWTTLWCWFWIQALYFLGVSPHRLAAMYRHVR